jgi:Outer membrane protein Omp28/Secretion system C-terminal sorting domain
MKKLHTILVLLFLTCAMSAQSSAKKYVLLEHFTNSRCGICASKNPAFYTLIGQAQYAPDIHHISVHPSVPYNTCVFYLANTTENNAWAAVYNIQGTPRVAVNGNLIPAQSQLLRQDTLTKYLNQTSPLYLKVTETGAGVMRTATIEARALSQIANGNYKLFVALAEKTVNQTTPNGESVHHDVFRDMLTPVAGQDFIPPAPGQVASFSFNYTMDAAWNANEVYVLAIVKNMDSKQVLNSGTRFDPALTLDASDISEQHIRFSPNPASDITFAEIGEDIALQTEVYALDGKRVYLTQGNTTGPVAIPTAAFEKGVYFVKITGEKGIYTAKLLKN